MKVRALRGVCAGVGNNLKAGDEADLDPGTASFLESIHAVEIVKEEPPEDDAPAVKDDPEKEEAKAPSDKKPVKASRKKTK